jgi:YebC/PmpR family DNA-binding regulatory protein
MAGHSAWKNIRHKKAAIDAKRGKLWSKCARSIIVAARHGGGDPDMNLSLRYAIDDARSVNMPKDTIEKAIKKGTGDLEAANYESAVYEGYAPHGVALLLEILTDNRNRTAGELRRIFERGGGNMGAAGCVSYIFTTMGQVFVPQAGVEEDTLMQVSLDAGAEDVKAAGESWHVLCEPAALVRVRAAVEKAGIPLESAGLTMLPNVSVTCSGETARKVISLIENLEDHDDVQKVYSNIEIPDQELAALSQ